MSSASYSALVCITTCARLQALRGYLPHFAGFTERDRRFSLLVALDGTEAPYLDFCEEWRVPLVYSDEREGVGLSKNRVLERFGDFDFYFFLDDDVELVDGSVFPRHVELARASGIHHFSLFQRGDVRRQVGVSVTDGTTLTHGLFGGGQFNFFTREGLERVGGWHPRFAEFRRWGHTEHSHRFATAGLAPAPFNVAEELADTCIWHYPPPVSSGTVKSADEDQITPVERELMDARLEHVPLTTLSPHHFNAIGFGEVGRLAETLAAGDRYPLLRGRERRRCQADFALWRARTAPSAVDRARYLLAAAWRWPSNPRLRHQLKVRR